MKNRIVSVFTLCTIAITAGEQHNHKNYDMVGTVLIDYHCGKHFNVNTLNKPTAIMLRAITKTLYDRIKEHCVQKLALHKKFIADNATDPLNLQRNASNNFCNQYSPTLIIKNQTLTSQWASVDNHTFFMGKKTNVLDTALHLTFLPQSLFLCPSGNSVSYSCIAREKATDVQNIQFGPHVRFPLKPDGSIAFCDMEMIYAPHDDYTSSKHNSNGYYQCYTDKEHTQCIAIEIFYNTEQNVRNYRVVVNSERRLDYTTPYDYFRLYSPVFHCDKISYTTLTDGKTPSYLEYQFKKGGSEMHCYEHYVQLSKDIVISLAELPLRLREHFEKSNKFRLIEDTISRTQRLIHTFVPNVDFSAEIFEEWAEFKKQILALKNDSKENTSVYNISRIIQKLCDREKLARYYQIDLVIGGLYIGEELQLKCLERRSPKATLYCSFYGSLYYVPLSDTEPKVLRDCFFKPMNPLEKLLRYLTPIGPLPQSSADYLEKKPSYALQVSAKTFLDLLISESQKCAQHTWDNGIIGAYWKFEPDGMRICVYDLEKDADNLVGTYFIQNCTEGDITNIEYEPGQEPIWYVCGERWQI